MSLLGIDVGTTGCKVSIIDYEGKIKKHAYTEYVIGRSNREIHEISPDTVWESVKQTIYEAVLNYKGSPVKAIGVSSFGEATVPIDKNGNVLDNSILYIDSRGIEEAGYLKKTLGNSKVARITGAGIHSMYTICKIMWIRENKNEIYNQTWKYLMFAAFILYRLGARPHTDYSLAARTMAFDITGKKWSEAILHAAQVDLGKLAEPVQAGSVVGRISSTMAAELGLPKDVLLVAGGHDQACAALGAGALDNGMAVDGAGTVECITPSFSSPVISDIMIENNYVCVPHVKKDMYVTYAFNFTCGSIMKWFRDEFAYKEKLEEKSTGKNAYGILIDNCSSTPSELFLLPHFAGAATPYMDVEAKGALIGLKTGTSRYEIVKAILEGLNYEMMLNLSFLENAGINIKQLRAVGGLAKSEYFLRLKADMMGIMVSSLNISEAGTLGVAILAGTGIGIFKSVDDASGKLVKIKKQYEPDLELHQQYLEKYEHYKRIYKAIKEIYE